MRAAIARGALPLLMLVLAACAGGPAPTTELSAAPATPTAAVPTAAPTPAPTPTSAPDTVYTADDEQIATLIRAGTDEAIPQLELLSDMGVEELTELFLPLKAWITAQKAGVEALTPSSCTEAAVALFIKGMDRYDDIREKFLAWREWGAVGNAFPIGAPGQAVATLEEALAELESTCPA